MHNAVEVNPYALIAIGAVAVFLASLFPKRAFDFYKPILENLGKREYRYGFRPFCPNWLTIWGLLVTVLGFILYLIWDPWWGIAIGAFGATLDRLDGKMACALGQTLSSPNSDCWRQDEYGNIKAMVTRSDGSTYDIIIVEPTKRFRLIWFELNFDGGTNLGEALDPFADKLKSTFVLAYFGWWTNVLNPWLVALMIAPEVFGTLIRRPFKFLRNWLYKSKATVIGKLKAITQWVVIVLCTPFDMGYCGAGILCHILQLIPNMILALSVLFAVFSVITKLATAQKYRLVRFIESRFGKIADHE